METEVRYDYKADEILDKYRKAGYVAESEIKEMAIIAIDMIIEEWDNECGRKAKQNYWRSIKAEIQARQ